MPVVATLDAAMVVQSTLASQLAAATDSFSTITEADSLPNNTKARQRKLRRAFSFSNKQNILFLNENKLDSNLF